MCSSDLRALARWLAGGAEMAAADARNLPAPVTITQHGGRLGTETDQAQLASLFSHLVGDVPDLHRLTDPAVLGAELTRIHRAHGAIRLHAFVGYGQRGRRS